MLEFAHYPDYTPQNRNHIQDIRREVHHCIVDSNGNSRLVTETNRWQVLNLGGRLFAKWLERSIYQRDIVNQPVYAHRSAPPFISQPAVVRSVLSPVNVPTAMKALPDMSIVVHPANTLIPHRFALVAHRPDMADNSMVQLVDMVVRFVQQMASGVETVLLSEVRQGRGYGHLGILDNSASLLQARLMSELLSNTLASLMQGPDDFQKAFDLFRLEKMLTAGKEGLSLTDVDLLHMVDSLFNQFSVAAEQQSSFFEQGYNPGSLKSGVAHSLNTESHALSRQIKLLEPGSDHNLKNGEKFAARETSSGNEAGYPESGIKAATGNHGIHMMPNQGTSVLTQASTVLGSNLSVVIQPPLVVESGQKQLPPIILPNINPGNRSDRRKSRKELKEEEEKEKEREGLSYIFDDDPLEPFDDE